MKTPYIRTSNKNVTPIVSKTFYLSQIESTTKNEKYKINNLEINSQYKLS